MHCLDRQRARTSPVRTPRLHAHPRGDAEGQALRPAPCPGVVLTTTGCTMYYKPLPHRRLLEQRHVNSEALWCTGSPCRCAKELIHWDNLTVLHCFEALNFEKHILQARR